MWGAVQFMGVNIIVQRGSGERHVERWGPGRNVIFVIGVLEKIFLLYVLRDLKSSEIGANLFSFSFISNILFIYG